MSAKVSADKATPLLRFVTGLEYNGHVENVCSGHCPECYCFPDRPTTAQIWRDENRVGHKEFCKRGVLIAQLISAVNTLPVAQKMYEALMVLIGDEAEGTRILRAEALAREAIALYESAKGEK